MKNNIKDFVGEHKKAICIGAGVTACVIAGAVLYKKGSVGLIIGALKNEE